MAFIELSVDYYDAVEKSNFSSFPNVAVLDNITSQGLLIQKDELLAHMMFTEQKDVTGFKTYAELERRIENRLNDIDEYLTFNGGSVQARFIGNDMYKDFTERLGVGLGLSVVSKIEGFSRADWKIIPTASGRSGHPTFDFEVPIASTGNYFVQAENKGSCVAKNGDQTGTVQKHYNSIKHKKNYVYKEEAKNGAVKYNNRYYGTIGVLDNTAHSKAKVWLVDPPAFQLEIEARKYKLLARLYYYLEEFRNIGVKPAILKAIETRIHQIEETSNYNEWNNVPLDYKYPTPFHLFMDGKMFVAIDSNAAFGRFFIVTKSNKQFVYIMAYPKSLMRIIVQQNFERILDFHYKPSFLDKVQVLMRAGKNDFKRRDQLKDVEFVFSERNRYYEATFFGKVQHTSDGKIFGMLTEQPNEE